MDLQVAFLLTFIAGGISAWVLMRMSKQVGQDRIGEIREHVASIGGVATDIDLVSAKDCPFSAEYHAPGIVYRFYRVGYLDGDEPKKMWAVLEVKRRRYGSALMSASNWVWRS